MTRNRSRMTRAQKAWDTANRGNYQPWPAGLTWEQRQARKQIAAYSHCLLYFVGDAAKNYEEIIGRADARSVAVLIQGMIERLERVAKEEQ